MTTKYVALAMIIIGAMLIWRGLRSTADLASGKIVLVIAGLFAGAVLGRCARLYVGKGYSDGDG